jgi:hypothetical protein
VPEEVSRYLEDVRNNLRLEKRAESEVINELQTHIEDRLSEMAEDGLSEEDAANECLRFLGSAKQVARQIYEAQSQGSWQQAGMGSLPHLLFALLFILNWWQGMGCLIVILGLVAGTAIYGWLHGRPIWLFPWLGYLLLPVIGAGLLLLYLPRGWSWVAIVVYVPLALWLIFAVTIQTIKKDWQYSALMVLPVPTVVAWFIAVADDGWFLGFSLEQVAQLANRIGLCFLILGLTALVFIRTRRRDLRVLLLICSGFLSLTVVSSYNGGLSLPVFILLNIITLVLMLSPALFERRLRHKENGETRPFVDRDITHIVGGH